MICFPLIVKSFNISDGRVSATVFDVINFYNFIFIVAVVGDGGVFALTESSEIELTESADHEIDVRSTMSNRTSVVSSNFLSPTFASEQLFFSTGNGFCF